MANFVEIENEDGVMVAVAPKTIGDLISATDVQGIVDGEIAIVRSEIALIEESVVRVGVTNINGYNPVVVAGINTLSLENNATVNVNLEIGQSAKLHVILGIYTLDITSQVGTIVWSWEETPTYELNKENIIEFWRIAHTIYANYLGYAPIVEYYYEEGA